MRRLPLRQQGIQAKGKKVVGQLQTDPLPQKGGLSGFVGEAVQARLFELTVEDAKERNGRYPQSEILAAIEEALADGQCE